MKRPVITPYQFNQYTSQIVDIYVALEDELFLQIAKRLKAPQEAGKDYVLQWQVERMQQLRMLNQETIKELSKATGIAAKEIEQMVNDVGFKSIKSIDEEVRGRYKQLPPPSQIDETLQGFVNQAFREMDNYVNQTLITTTFGRGTVSDTYRRIVEESTAQVLAGNKTINQAVADTVIKWADKGIATGFVDKGGRTWHLEQYSRTLIRNTVNRTYNDLRMSRMQEYDVGLVVMSSHAAARPACAPIQGKVLDITEDRRNPDYLNIYDYGYGEPWGTRGINCNHRYFPYIEGVNTNNQPQVDEEEAVERYKLTQRQRYYERQIRKAKRSLNLAKELGDEGTISKYGKLVRNRQAKVREFIKENKLPRRYDNEQIYSR